MIPVSPRLESLKMIDIKATHSCINKNQMGHLTAPNSMTCSNTVTNWKAQHLNKLNCQSSLKLNSKSSLCEQLDHTIAFELSSESSN